MRKFFLPCYFLSSSDTDICVSNRHFVDIFRAENFVRSAGKQGVDIPELKWVALRMDVSEGTLERRTGEAKADTKDW